MTILLLSSMLRALLSRAGSWLWSDQPILIGVCCVYVKADNDLLLREEIDMFRMFRLASDTFFVIAWSNFVLMIMYRMDCFYWLAELLKEVMK